MTSTPTPPDQSHAATDLGDGGNLPNPEAPSRVGVGFPTGAVRALRNAIEHPRAEEDVTLSRIAGLAVLAWIDRHVPRAIRTVEHEIQVGGVGVFTIESEEPFVDSVELIRLNGRPFVPETPAEEPSIDDVEREIGRVLIDLAGYESHSAGVLGLVRREIDDPGCVKRDIDAAVARIAAQPSFLRAEGPTPPVIDPGAAGEAAARAAGLPELYLRRARPSEEWPLTPPVNHEAANRERAGVCDTVEARAARKSFAEPQADPIHKGGGRTSIHRSHRAEGGPNFVD